MDWDSRIEGYSMDTKNLYNRMFEKRKTLLHLLTMETSDDGWLKTTERIGFVVEEKISSRGLPSIRVRCSYDYDALTIFRAYSDPFNRKVYDPFVDEVYTTKMYGVGLYNLYQKTQRILMVAPREFNVYMLTTVE
jgi:hypothetical protein